MLDTHGEVINTLKTLNDYYCLKSNFIIYPKSNKSCNRDREPFRPGFLCGIEIREELIKRLDKLSKKERTTLLLYYTFYKSIGYIAEKLCISCRHCYRIRKKAIEGIINFGKEENIS